MDKYSFYNAEEVWAPQAVKDGGSYGMADLIRHAQGGLTARRSVDPLRRIGDQDVYDNP